MALYLDVPYSEKDEAKKLGARWILKDTDDAVIATEYLHIIEGGQRCGKSTRIGGKCFANHCDCCGALQGNWFIFDEPDSPLSSCVGGEELIERMGRLKIKLIPIDDDLQLNWNMGFCSNDFAYLKYGKKEELILSADPDNEYVSYEELYLGQRLDSREV